MQNFYWTFLINFKIKHNKHNNNNLCSDIDTGFIKLSNKENYFIAILFVITILFL